MKIIVMSDTHLYRLTDEFERICDEYCRDADLVIHLGDWMASSVVSYLEQYPLKAVAGNMDGSAIRDQLPEKRIIKVGRFRIGMIHGWGSSSDLIARLSREFSNVDVVLFGHTHQPATFEGNGILWFNPGSVFLGRGKPRRSLGILHVHDSIETEIVAL